MQLYDLLQQPLTIMYNQVSRYEKNSKNSELTVIQIVIDICFNNKPTLWEGFFKVNLSAKKRLGCKSPYKQRVYSIRVCISDCFNRIIKNPLEGLLDC